MLFTSLVEGLFTNLVAVRSTNYLAEITSSLENFQNDCTATRQRARCWVMSVFFVLFLQHKQRYCGLCQYCTIWRQRPDSSRRQKSPERAKRAKTMDPKPSSSLKCHFRVCLGKERNCKSACDCGPYKSSPEPPSLVVPYRLSRCRQAEVYPGRPLRGACQ